MSDGARLLLVKRFAVPLGRNQGTLMPGPNFFRFLNFLILLFSFIVGGISTLSTHIKSTDCFSSIIETGSTSRF